MSAVEFRSLVIDDYDNIIALWANTQGVRLRGADSIDGIRKYLHRNPGLSFVAEKEGTIVGTIMGGHDGKRGYIQHLAVADDHRRQGVGGTLIKLCLDALKEEGILKSHIHVLVENENGKRFWRGRGWFARDDLEVYSFINSTDTNV